MPLTVGGDCRRIVETVSVFCCYHDHGLPEILACSRSVDHGGQQTRIAGRAQSIDATPRRRIPAFDSDKSLAVAQSPW